ncbi:hypothetical protein AB0K60_29450 [Thermopolyspora sp. NPDC052614]|uniref:hypothetical protein n=1 Tax=Thermopolyspora sp. NPDC052614 TaxID=3155682 RepID=UPI00342F1D2B
MTRRSEAELVAEAVDIHDWGPTEPDEEQVLVSLGYVLNPETGVYERRPNGRRT